MTEGHLQYLSSAEVRTTQHIQLLSAAFSQFTKMIQNTFIFNLQGHSKLLELLRNHIVPSTAVSTPHFLRVPFTSFTSSDSGSFSCFEAGGL